MRDQVEEIKSKIDIVDIISEYVDLKKAGANWKGVCPFHSEKTPSFMVNPELQIFKCFGCFPAGQFVKTPFGYHKIEDIAEGEYVISGKGNLKKVLIKHNRDYNGTLVTVKLSQLTEPISLTQDHNIFVVDGAKMYTSRYKYLSKRLRSYRKYSRQKALEKIWKYFPIKKIPAGMITKGMTLLYPIDKTVADLERIDLSSYITKVWPPHGTKPLIPPLDIAVDKDFLKLLGYYIAEGSNHRGYIRFSLGNHEEKFALEIVKLVKKIFGLQATIHRRPTSEKTGLEVTACNSILANISGNLCGKGSNNKHIPFVLQQLPVKKQLILLRAILKGDGYTIPAKGIATSEREAITTTSRTLSEQITDIVLRAGHFPSRTVHKEKYDKLDVHHKEAFSISWSNNPEVSKFQHIYKAQDGSTYWLLPALKVTKSNFLGQVYNLTVSEDHSYVANTFAVANCGESGDVFTFLEKYEGMEFYETLKYLAEKAGVVLEHTILPQKNDKEKLYEVNNLAHRFYQYMLSKHTAGKPALSYLTDKRGLDVNTITAFEIGFAPNDFSALTKVLIVKKKASAAELEKVGLCYLKNGRPIDRFRGRVMFPAHDHRGNLCGFAGRILPELDNGETGKYINSPETILHHKGSLLFGLWQTRKEIKRVGFAVLVEGPMDAIASFQGGVKNVVAIQGTSLTQEQVKLLSRFTKKIVFCLDSDFAGVGAERRGILLAEAEGLEVRVAKLVDFKDPGEAAIVNPKAYKKAIADSVGVWDFLIDSVIGKYKVIDGTNKAKISRELAPLLGDIRDEIVRAHYIGEVARKLLVPEEAVSLEVNKRQTRTETSNMQPEPTVRLKKPVGKIWRKSLFLLHLVRTLLTFLLFPTYRKKLPHHF